MREGGIKVCETRVQSTIPFTTHSFSIRTKKERCITSEGKETKEGNLINLLLGIMDLFKEAEMGIGLDGIVAIGDHGSKGIGDVAAVDDGDGFLHVPG